MTLSLFLAMMSAIFSRIASRTFWRWLKRSPAERSERSDSVGRYSRKMVSLLICRPGPLSLWRLYYDVTRHARHRRVRESPPNWCLPLNVPTPLPLGRSQHNYREAFRLLRFSSGELRISASDTRSE